MENDNHKWIANYQQEPLPIVDCNDCSNISITETQQRGMGSDKPHICGVYNKHCFHESRERDAYFIYPCRDCMADNFKNFQNGIKGVRNEKKETRN